MIPMVAGQGANAIWAQELVLIEHSGENAAQLLFVHNGDHPPSRYAGRARHVHIGCEFRMTIIEVSCTPPEVRELLQDIFLENRHSREGKQPNHRPHL